MDAYRYDRFRATCAQLLATLAFETLMVNVGLIIGMPTLIIGALTQPSSDLKFTEDEASWFAGLIFIAQPLGSVASSFLQDLLGRKFCMMLVNVPQLIAWLAIYRATNVLTLFVALAAMGLSLGFMEAPVLSYIGEISEPRLRGVFNTLGGIFFNIGLLVLNSIGAATNWRTLALICAASPVVAFLALAMIPESPAWLVSKGRVKDAERAYQWLRGWAPPEAVREELHALVAYVRQSHAPRIVNSHEYKVAGIDEGTIAVSREHESKLKALLHPSVLRPLRLIVAYFFIAACASLCALKPFIIDFMTKLDLPIKPHLVLVYCSVLVILGSLTSTLLMRRIGKRGLTCWSFGLALPCCFGLGLYIHFDLHLPWLALAFICVSSYAPPLGMIPIPWFLISEVFPLKSRGMASGVAAALGYLIMFLVIKTYFSIVSLVGVPGSFILYGVVGLLGMVYLYFRLPETEGVTLQDVERIFNEDCSTLVNSDNQNINDTESEQIPV